MTTDRPNILLLCTDQQRYNALGAYGNTEIETPNLDRLADQGVLFENCYVQCTVCAPSRASLMTGQYVHSHGLWANGVTLPGHQRVFSEELAERGYDCGLVGKYHLTACHAGRTESAPPGMRTFRWAHDPYPGSSENAYHRWLAAAHPDVHEQAMRSHGDLDAGDRLRFDEVPTEAHYSRWIGNETIDWLRHGRREGQPFCFIANFFDPHHGFGAPKEYLDRYRAEQLSRPVTTGDELDHKPEVYRSVSQRSYAGHAKGYAQYSAAELQEVKAAYYAMVTLVDDEVGRILDVLEAEGLADDTVVVFTSDHGEMLGDHQLMLKGPMMYDVAIRVPLLMRWPGRFPAGRRVDELVQWIDLTSTVTELAGSPGMPSAQGKSLVGLASGTTDEHRGWALCEYRDSGHGDSPAVHTTMVRRGPYKLVTHHGAPASGRPRGGELYDLAVDPDELTNLYDDPAHRELRQEMSELTTDVLVGTEDRHAVREAPW